MMLSRTADHLYWMSRYLERAESLARLLDVSLSLSLLPHSQGGREELKAPLLITETLEAYNSRYSSISTPNLLHFMALDPTNPASIVSCFKLARENAHAVRGKIPAEMWENVNATWWEAREYSQGQVDNIGNFFDWVKARSHLFRGVAYGTMLRGDAYSFIRLGTFIERADNTARLLDMKASLMDNPHAVNEDYYGWTALLKALSAHEAYLEIYRDTVAMKPVAELLMLSTRLPRSVNACLEAICKILAQIEGNSGRLTQKQANDLYNQIRFAKVEDILETGLHDYLNEFLININGLGDTIYEAYLKAV